MMGQDVQGFIGNCKDLKSKVENRLFKVVSLQLKRFTLAVLLRTGWSGLRVKVGKPVWRML